MHIYIYLPLSLEILRKKVQEYKKREREKGIKIHDLETHPEPFDNQEQFTLWYGETDWLGFSDFFPVSKNTVRRFGDSDIDLSRHESKIIFSINRHKYTKKFYNTGYGRIKDFIDFLGVDYIAEGDSMTFTFDLDTGETNKVFV